MIISGGMRLTLRVVLALVFGVAGISKLVDRAGARQSIREFGMPAATAGPLAVALVLAELAGAAALLTGRWGWWGAAVSLALLALFIAAIVGNLLRGRWAGQRWPATWCSPHSLASCCCRATATPVPAWPSGSPA
jgi:uncharacterized membrane protein YphA (DoxX/SURF4 family)